MSDIGNAVSGARFAMNPTPLGAASLIGGMALGGKGGGKTPFKPSLASADTLMDDYSGKTFDYSGTRINGDEGSYNFMKMMGDTKPAITDVKANQGQAIANLLRSDPAALSAFDAKYRVPVGPDTFGVNSLIEKLHGPTYNLPTVRNMFGQAGLYQGNTLKSANMLGPGNNKYEIPAFQAMTRLLSDSAYPTLQKSTQPQQPQTQYTPSAQLLAQIAAARSQQ